MSSLAGALARTSATSQSRRSGGMPPQLMPQDKPGFFSRALGDASDLLMGLPRGLFNLGKASITAPFIGAASGLSDDIKWEDSTAGQVTSEVGKSLVSTANLLFDDLLPMQYVREAAESGDWNPIGGEPAQAYRERLGEHGRDFLERPVTFGVEHAGNIALAGAVAGRGLSAGAIRGGADDATRAAVREAGPAARARARAIDVDSTSRTGRTVQRAARSIPGQEFQAAGARRVARQQALDKIVAQGGPKAPMARSAQVASDIVAHPYQAGLGAANKGAGRFLAMGTGEPSTLTGLFKDIANRPAWTQSANRARAIEGDIQAKTEQLQEGIGQLDSDPTLPLNERWERANELGELEKDIRQRRLELDDHQTQNADAIRRGQASLSDEGLATLHPIAAAVQRTRNTMPTAVGASRNLREKALFRADTLMDSGRRNIARRARILRDDLAQSQSDIAARNTIQGRRDLVNTELNSTGLRRDMEAVGIEMPRFFGRLSDRELLDVGQRVLEAVDKGDIDAGKYPRLFQDESLQRAVLSSYERVAELPEGSITRQITDAEVYSTLPERFREGQRALQETSPEAAEQIAVGNRAHNALLEDVPDAAKIGEGLPPEISAVAEQVRSGYRNRVASQEMAKLERGQIPGQGTRTRVDPETGERVAMDASEKVDLSTPALSARQARTYRSMNRRLQSVEKRLTRTREIVERDGAWDAPDAVNEIRAISRDLEGDIKQLADEQAALRARAIENAGRRDRGEPELGTEDLGLSMEPEYIDTALDDLQEMYELANLSLPARIRPGTRVDKASSGELYGEATGPVRAAGQRYANETARVRARQPELEARANIIETTRKLNSDLDSEIALFRRRGRQREINPPDPARVSALIRQLGAAYDTAGMAKPRWLKPNSQVLQEMRLLMHGSPQPGFADRLRSARREDGVRMGTAAQRAAQQLDEGFQSRMAAADNLENKRMEAAKAPADDVRKSVQADRERLAIRRRETKKAINGLERLEKSYASMQEKFETRYREMLDSIEAAPATARPYLDAARTLGPEMDQALRENGLHQLADRLNLAGLPQTLDAMAEAGVDLSYVPRVMLEEAATGQGHYFSSSESTLKTPRPNYAKRRTIGDVAVETDFDMLNIQQQSAMMADHMKRETAEAVIKDHGRTLQEVLEENSTRLYTLRELDFLNEIMSEQRSGAASNLLDPDAIANLTKNQRERLAAQLGYAYFDPEQIFAVRIRRTGDEGQWLPSSMVEGLRIYKQAGTFEQIMTNVVQPLTTKWKNMILALRPGWHVYNAIGSPAMALASGAIDASGYLRYMAGEAPGMVDDFLRGRDMSDYGLTEKAARDLFGENNPLLDRGATPHDPGLAAMNNESIKAFAADAMRRDRNARAREGGFFDLVKEGQGLIAATAAGARRTAHGANRMIQGSYKANAFMDNVNRAAVYLHQTNALGRSPDAAMRVVGDVLGDYTNMTHVERLYIRNAIPFYAWLRHITKLMTKMHQPDSITRTILLEHLTNLASDPNEDFANAPSWAQGDVPLGDSGVNLATRGFNPFGDIFGPIMSAGRFDPLKGIGSQSNPLLQFIGERTFGTDLQTGRPFSRPVPVINEDGQEVPTPPSMGRHLMDTFMPPQVPALAQGAEDVGRFVTGMDPALRMPTYGSGEPVALEGAEPRSSAQAIGSLFGLNVRSVDMESAAERRANAVDRVVRARERYNQQLAERQQQHAAQNAGPSGLPGMLFGG